MQGRVGYVKQDDKYLYLRDLVVVIESMKETTFIKIFAWKDVCVMTVDYDLSTLKGTWTIHDVSLQGVTSEYGPAWHEIGCVEEEDGSVRCDSLTCLGFWLLVPAHM